MTTKTFKPGSFDPALVACLTYYSSDFVRNSHQALVAADRACELDLAGLEFLLRFLVEWDLTPTNLLFTGSRRYGIPHAESDFDWVCKIDRYLTVELELKADEVIKPDDYIPSPNQRRIPAIDVSLRFGPINLICVHLNVQHYCWIEGTARLVEETARAGNRTRDQAIAVFTSLRDRHLIDEPDY